MMNKDWHNVTVEVEVMVSTEVGEQPDLDKLALEIRNAVEQVRKTWAAARNARVVHTVTE